MNPKVSVCIVTYNHEKYIRQCLQSVVDQLINCDIEIIVSDDCSTDQTCSIISEFYAAYPSKIRPIFLEKNIGAYENFICVHNLALGEYICHCDGDDYFLPGKLQAQVDVLEADPTCTAVWHRVDFFDDAGHFCSGETADMTPFSDGVVTFDKAVCLGFVGVHSSLMYRRSAQKYRPQPGERWLDLFRTWDVLSSGNGRVLNDILGRYRVAAEGSITSSSLLKIRRLSIQHARFFYQQFPQSRQSFFIFSISNFILDLKNSRRSACNFLIFSIECFSMSSILKIIHNLVELRKIQVDWKHSRTQKERNKRVLINCSNLHHGGGVAVATSFLASLSRMKRSENMSVLVSSLVHKNLQALGISSDHFKFYKVIDYIGLESIWKRIDKYFSGYDIVFTVFGPAYFLHKHTQHIFGFAQANIVYPRNLYEHKLPLLIRLKQRMKYFVHSLFFMRANALIVELDHVKTGLLKQWMYKNLPIHIVNAAVDEIYSDPKKWQTVTMPSKNKRLKLGIASKNYPHKNLACLPLVKEILLRRYGIEADFFVTFSDDEWNRCDKKFQQSVVNVGELTLAQCPSFYQALDGVVFPSLLECFSAVPIEAMMMKKPLFASNLPFIVDCCHQHANYFYPLDSQDIAKSIHSYFRKSSSEQNEFIDSAYQFVQTYPSAHDRALKYLDICQML